MADGLSPRALLALSENVDLRNFLAQLRAEQVERVAGMDCVVDAALIVDGVRRIQVIDSIVDEVRGAGYRAKKEIET